MQKVWKSNVVPDSPLTAWQPRRVKLSTDEALIQFHDRCHTLYISANLPSFDTELVVAEPLSFLPKSAGKGIAR
jgi:hypothetical protein